MSRKSVLITGVSSGLGHGLAHGYLDKGWSVFGISRRTPSELVARDAFRHVASDLGDSRRIPETVDSLLNGRCELDLAVLNAGILGEIADLRETRLDAIRPVMEINLWANKSLIDWLLNPPMKVRQVVAISSGASINGHRGWGGYAISKAALNMLIKLYAMEAPQTHFSALAPGLVDTEIQEDLCSRESDERFPSIDYLKSKRNTPEMPVPADAALRLMDAIDRLPSFVASGQYVDIRKPPLCDASSA